MSKTNSMFRCACSLLATATLLSVSRADTVETRDGARLIGTLVSISGGKVLLKTSYAGDLTIKQSEVTALITDQPVSLRSEDGAVQTGSLSMTGPLVRPSGAAARPVAGAGIRTAWLAGAREPAPPAVQKPHWTYEAGLDLTGRTGNKEQFGTALRGRATYKTPRNTLQYYANYDREVTNGAKSADQLKAGTDYQDNFSGLLSWYARTEGGFDKIKDLRLYDVTGTGLGYDFIHQPTHTLTTRAGFSLRYEKHGDPQTADNSGTGLDLGVNHEWQLAPAKLVNRLTLVPGFNDLGNFRFTHETFYELPLAAPSWKLRVGLSHDYNSRPGSGTERLDTSYFTRLVLTWE